MADVGPRAARSDLVVVRHVNVEDELALDRTEDLLLVGLVLRRLRDTEGKKCKTRVPGGTTANSQLSSHPRSVAQTARTGREKTAPMSILIGC